MCPSRSASRFLSLTLAVLAASFLAACQAVDTRHHVLVSVKDQKMVLFEHKQAVKVYPVSTSKYGIGDEPGSYRTPEGTMQVARKIGDGAPRGAVFKNRRWTGEVLDPDSPGRDPIVTRILWLKGKEERNRNAYRRMIYIHGTTEEARLGEPVSFGCIRMASTDAEDLFQRVGVGTPVTVTRGRLPLKTRTAQAVERMGDAVGSAGKRLAATGMNWLRPDGKEEEQQEPG